MTSHHQFTPLMGSSIGKAYDAALDTTTNVKEMVEAQHKILELANESINVEQFIALIGRDFEKEAAAIIIRAILTKDPF